MQVTGQSEMTSRSLNTTWTQHDIECVQAMECHVIQGEPPLHHQGHSLVHLLQVVCHDARSQMSQPHQLEFHLSLQSLAAAHPRLLVRYRENARNARLRTHTQQFPGNALNAIMQTPDVDQHARWTRPKPLAATGACPSGEYHRTRSPIQEDQYDMWIKKMTLADACRRRPCNCGG